jgi:hypothetical protein
MGGGDLIGMLAPPKPQRASIYMSSIRSDMRLIAGFGVLFWANACRDLTWLCFALLQLPIHLTPLLLRADDKLPAAQTRLRPRESRP